MKFSKFIRCFGFAMILAGALAPGMVRAQSSSSMNMDLDENKDDRGGNYLQGISSGAQSGLSGSSAASDFRDFPNSQTPFIGDFPLDETLYKVGPGDLFQIVVEGASFDKQVNPEGNLILNRIGVVKLKGLTLKDAKKQILDNLETSYKRRNCFVNLSRPKDMRVFVTGAVNSPGIVEIPGIYRLSDALRKVGGYSMMAQKGTVEIRENGTSRVIKTSAFAMKGDLDANPYLNPGAVVFVPFLDYDQPWVRIKGDSGSFTVQMDNDESLADLIMKGYSFKAPPVYQALLVKEKDGKEIVLPAAEALRYKPRSEAIIEIFSSRQDVFVGGAVTTPGRQAYRPDQRVIEYISRAGLITSSRIPSRISVLRSNGARETLGLEDSNIRPGDVILIKQNTEQKFLLYTPILLSVVSLALVYLQVSK